MSSSSLRSFNPCTGDLVWEGPVSSPADMDQAVTTARRGASAWGETPLEARRKVALTFAGLVTERRAAIARLIAEETGKPYWETLTEADSVAAKVAISIRAQDQRAGETLSDAAGVRQALRHRPHGVMAVLGPFNFPMHLANGHIVPALLAGNAVVFKPSEKTPASGALMAEIWKAAGLPEGVLQVVQGGAEVGATLVSHPGIDGVLFTGSVKAGRMIHRLMADTPWKVLALELGGNNPLIAWDVDNAEDAAHLIVQSAFISAGQRCSCARKLVVETGARGDRLIEALTGVMSRLRTGAPFDDPEPYMGPVIDNPAADTLLGANTALAAAGGKVIRGLERLDPALPLLHPGLVDVSSIENLPDDELFGPLLQVVRFDTFDQALAEAGRTRFGLAAGLIGGDQVLFDRFWRGVRAGVVNWNRPTTGASSAAPFGGVGASGNHRPSAFYAADYCAYPVAGLEAPEMSFRIGNGLHPPAGAA